MNEQLQAQLLSQLKDVHLPEPVSWWPLAIGWWVLIALTVITSSGCLYLLWSRHKHNRYRKQALNELNSHFTHWQSHADDKAYIAAANDLLKRVIRVFKPNLLTQFSDAWVDSLDSLSKTPLSQNARFALAHQCYQAHVKADIKTLNNELIHWLKQHKHEAKDA